MELVACFHEEKNLKCSESSKPTRDVIRKGELEGKSKAKVNLSRCMKMVKKLVEEAKKTNEEARTLAQQMEECRKALAAMVDLARGKERELAANDAVIANLKEQLEAKENEVKELLRAKDGEVEDSYLGEEDGQIEMLIKWERRVQAAILESKGEGRVEEVKENIFEEQSISMPAKKSKTASDGRSDRSVNQITKTKLVSLNTNQGPKSPRKSTEPTISAAIQPAGEKKRFCCSQCSKTFTLKRLLYKHVKVHVKLICTKQSCGAKFLTWQQLNKHMIYNHKMEVTSMI